MAITRGNSGIVLLIESIIFIVVMGIKPAWINNACLDLWM